MALRLWKKFQEYEDAGIVTQMLVEIFREGSKLGFRPPPKNGTTTVLSRPGTAVTMQNENRNTPGTPDAGTATAAANTTPANAAPTSAPTTPRQAFRRSIALTPSNGSFSGPGSGDFFGGSPLR